MFTNEHNNSFGDITKWFLKYFGGLILLWSRGFTIFESRIPKWLLSNSKAVNICEDKKTKQIVPVLKWYLEKFDIKPRLV